MKNIPLENFNIIKEIKNDPDNNGLNLKITNFCFFNEKDNKNQNYFGILGNDLYKELGFYGRFNEWFNHKIKKLSLIEYKDYVRINETNKKYSIYILSDGFKQICYKELFEDKNKLFLNFYQKFLKENSSFLNSNNNSKIVQNILNDKEKKECKNSCQKDKCKGNCSDDKEKVELSTIPSADIKTSSHINNNIKNFDNNVSQENIETQKVEKEIVDLKSKYNVAGNTQPYYFFEEKNKLVYNEFIEYLYTIRELDKINVIANKAINIVEALNGFIIMKMIQFNTSIVTVELENLWRDIYYYFKRPLNVSEMERDLFIRIKNYLNIERQLKFSDKITSQMFYMLILYFNYFYHQK